MSTQNEDSNNRQPFPGALVEHPAFDGNEPLAGDAIAVGPVEAPAMSKGTTQSAIERHPKELERNQKVSRGTARNGQNEAQTSALEPAAPTAKPVRVKRATTRSPDEVKGQAEAVNKPKRTSTKKASKVAVSPVSAAPAGSDMPPVTLAAIEFLGKRDATAADVLNLGPDSFAFVRYHFKQMQQLEADSRLTNAYLIANARPTTPAFQQLADALAKRGSRQRGHETVQPDQVWGPKNQQPANVAIPSYGPKAVTFPAYKPVVVQLGKQEFGRQALDLAVPTETADRAEEAKATPGWKVMQALENSIERSPVQLVAAQEGPSAPRAAEAQQSTTAEKFVEEPAASAAPSYKVSTDPIPRTSFGRRLGRVLGNIANWAGNWLLGQNKEAHPPGASASASMDKSAAPPASLREGAAIVPESVAQRFLKVGSEYYHYDRTPAFSDQGNRLATRGDNPDVVRSLVEIAKARGWDTITVKGAENFRRSAWLEATQNGLTVVGYKPTALDLADLANRPAKNSVEKGGVQEKTSVPRQQTAHRERAHKSAQPPASANGASKESAPLRPQPDLELVAKAKAFQEDKPVFVVKKYPDLAAAYGVVAAAEAFAKDRLPEEAREEFVEMARLHMVDKIKTGKQIRGPRIYLAPTKSTDIDTQTKSASQAIDRRKPPKAKTVERDR